MNGIVLLWLVLTVSLSFLLRSSLSASVGLSASEVACSESRYYSASDERCVSCRAKRDCGQQPVRQECDAYCKCDCNKRDKKKRPGVQEVLVQPRTLPVGNSCPPNQYFDVAQDHCVKCIRQHECHQKPVRSECMHTCDSYSRRSEARPISRRRRSEECGANRYYDLGLGGCVDCTSHDCHQTAVREECRSKCDTLKPKVTPKPTPNATIDETLKLPGPSGETEEPRSGGEKMASEGEWPRVGERLDAEEEKAAAGKMPLYILSGCLIALILAIAIITTIAVMRCLARRGHDDLARYGDEELHKELLRRQHSSSTASNSSASPVPESLPATPDTIIVEPCYVTKPSVTSLPTTQTIYQSVEEQPVVSCH